MTAIAVLAIFVIQYDLVVPLSEYSTKDGAGAPVFPLPLTGPPPVGRGGRGHMGLIAAPASGRSFPRAEEPTPAPLVPPTAPAYSAAP
jgi:hypothetical protein